MNMLGKKKISTIQTKKIAPLSRLIKCYVCNQHFESQPQFDIHIKQHQSKLNRTNVEQIQRKTQESFAKKKQPLMLNKTQSQIRPIKEKVEIEKSKDVPILKKQSMNDDEEENQIQEALRESQILLEKIEFLTQPPSAEISQPEPTPATEDIQYIEKCIEGERKLYQLISKAQNTANIEKFILQTDFETRYFQNYQDQLIHLRILASAAVAPASVAKIMDIRKKICRDICNELKQHYQVKDPVQKMKVKTVVDAELTQNTGQVKYCAQCYEIVGGMDDLYQLKCGHCYHPECWNGQCCS